MKQIRIRYTTLLDLKEDMQKAFPNWGGNRQTVTYALKKRNMFINPVRDAVTNALLHIDVYVLVRDSFTVPLWIQGVEVPHSDVDPFTHVWQGHEVAVPDDLNEEPEETL